MGEEKNIRCQIHCQKGRRIDAELSKDTGIYEKDGVYLEIKDRIIEEGRYGEIRLDMKNDSCGENSNLKMEKPIRVYLPVEECPERITAMYLYSEWWTRPAFVSSFEDIPDFTQVAFFKYKNKFACFVPMVGREFKAYMVSGTGTEICLEMTSRLGGQRKIEEPLYLLTEGFTLEEAVHRAFKWLAEYKGIRMSESRRIPEMFKFLGWCSWDAFYKEVSEDKIRQKADELAQKNVPVNWMIIDDGWLSVQDEQLYDFAPDKTKFPDGFKNMIKDIKEKGDIRWFGVWHALGGYWSGILQDSGLDIKEHSYLYRTVGGKVLPSPESGERFYRDWYKELRHEGIDFVKVDGQSSVPCYFENSLPVSEAARGMHQALEGAASYMDGAIINCMGMAMENILARPTSAISRNSEDFFPNRENGFAEHLIQNAYNAVYHNELYCCDWDMFWTEHKDSVKHSLLRAISGGPVYFSDKIGDTNPDVLKPLMYLDGRILMMDRSAKPTEDCMFVDPTKQGVLKLHNAASMGEDQKGGGIAIYNLTKENQTFSFRASDVPELAGFDQYWIYDYFKGEAFSLERDEEYEGTVQSGGFAWFIIIPKGKQSSCFGLIDKYAGFLAVESICENESTTVAVIHESGALAWMSEKIPQKVKINGEDITENVERNDCLYILRIPETSHKAVLSIDW